MTKIPNILSVFVTVVCFFTVIFCPIGAHKLPGDHTCTREKPGAFAWADYLVLGTMLAVSCGIGVFFGFCGSKQETGADFLLGGSSMGTVPMAMSLAASFVTAVELLGNPAEMYSHGSQFWIICLAFILVIPVTSKLYLPVFMGLRLTSSYEYLSMRFSPKVRYLASGLYIMQMVSYTSVAVYAPALALSHITGLNVYMAVTVVYAVCIFYASQGGMKAVIIADTFQAIVLVASLLVIACLGEKYIGGSGPLWSENYNTNRLELFNFDPSPTVRHSFWSVVIGGSFYWMTMFCSNQASIQKYLSVLTIGQFKIADYLVLGTMLAVSCGIGVFFGFCGSKQETGADFLLGGSSMGTVPMAMSLAASFVTAVELLGNPAEMYSHGSQFWIICLAFILVIPVTSKLYLPVFMGLRLTSSYEYLSMRFSPKVRYLASGLYIMQMVSYTSVAVYAPALALSHITGLNVYMAVTVVYAVCIFYASQGGMKAVIIADTFQAIVLVASLLVIACLGEKYIGGSGPLWSENYNTNRLELFNFDPSPTVRHSFWSVVIGGSFYWMTMFCSNQASIQKYLSVLTIGQVRKALWASCLCLILVFTINFYTGMILVAHYKNCDPIRSGQIKSTDEILPFFVTSTMGHLQGMTGLFAAGIFAASLGTVASALNSLAAVTLQDFVGSAFKIHLPETKGAFWAQILSALYGIISFGLIFVVAQLGGVMQVAISFNGMVGGVTLGLFSLGMFFPWANSRGALFGSVLACCLITLMCLGQQITLANGSLEEETKPTRIEGCDCLNITSPLIHKVDEEKPFFLYRVSYIWYSMIGFLVTLVMGLVGSFVTGLQNPKDVDVDLVSPPVIKFLMSLSNGTKEFLNLPLKPHSNKWKEKKVPTNNFDLFKAPEVPVVRRKISAPT